MKCNFLRRVWVHLQASYLALVYLSSRPRIGPQPIRQVAPDPTVGRILLSFALTFGVLAWAFPIFGYVSIFYDAFVSEKLMDADGMLVIGGTPLVMLALGFAGAYVCLWASKDIRTLQPRAWRIARFLCFQSFTVAIGLSLVLRLLFRRP